MLNCPAVNVAIYFQGNFEASFRESMSRCVAAALLVPCEPHEFSGTPGPGLLILEGPADVAKFQELQNKITLLTSENKNLCILVAHRWNLLSADLMPWLDSGAVGLVHLDTDPHHAIDAFAEVLRKKLA
jgi:hypothetical protein